MIERTFFCDGPECDRHVRTIRSRPQASFLIVTEDTSHALHFCGWDCILRYAATKEPEEVING